MTTNKQYFEGIGKIRYEGPQTDNPLAFRWYDENKLVAGKTMKEHLRFACAYWHSFCGNGSDPFGEPTHEFGWNAVEDAVDRAKKKMDVAFEFMQKLGMPFYCFHDVDVVDFSNDVKEILTGNEYDMICFFTPGGVRSFIENFPKFKQNGTKIGTFGDNTFKAAADAGLTLDIKAPQPKMPSMVSALDQYLGSLTKK